MKIIFVGSFAGIKGGVGLACKMLLDNPHLTNIEWVKICSAMKSLPPPGLAVRAYYAARRVIRFMAALAAGSSCRVLIFSSAGGSFLEKGLMAVVAKSCGYPVTFCPRSGHLFGDLESSMFWRGFARLVFNRCDYIVCQGNSWKTHFSPLVQDQNRLIVIPNQMSCPDHLELSPPVRKPGEPTVFVMLGWMERNKGIYDLLQVVESHRADFQDCRFVLCGEGGCLDDFRKQVDARSLNHLISTPGWVDGAGKLEVIARADVVLILSYREGLPNVLLEAMAAGRPVLATRVGAIPDVVVDNESGILCEPGDTDDIHRGMIALLRDSSLRLRLATRARELFLSTNDLGRTGHLWLPVLSRLSID